MDELINGLAMSGYLFRREDIQSLFNYVDADQSGALDFAEVRKFKQKNLLNARI
jgi:Ca2+-binding EF-hand superfamily protein